MKKLISILIVMLALMILCTACDPTLSKKVRNNNPTYPVELTTYEEFMSAVNDMGGKEEFWSTTNLNKDDFKRANSRSNFESFFSEVGFNNTSYVARVSANVIEMSFTSGWRILLFVDTVEGEAEARTYTNSGGSSKYPIVITSLTEYRTAWDEIKPYGQSYYTDSPNGWTTQLIDSVYREGNLNFASRRVLRISDNCIEIYTGVGYIYLHNTAGIEDARIEGLKH